MLFVKVTPWSKGALLDAVCRYSWLFKALSQSTMPLPHGGTLLVGWEGCSPSLLYHQESSSSLGTTAATCHISWLRLKLSFWMQPGRR